MNHLFLKPLYQAWWCTYNHNIYLLWKIYLYILPYLKTEMLHVVENISPIYRQTSDISRTSVGHIIVDNSDVVGASSVGAAPTTSSLST